MKQIPDIVLRLEVLQGLQIGIIDHIESLKSLDRILDKIYLQENVIDDLTAYNEFNNHHFDKLEELNLELLKIRQEIKTLEWVLEKKNGI